MKNALIHALKLALVVGLVYWLVHTGKLDFKQLAVFIDRPVTFVLNVLLWGFGFTMLGAFRWYVLLRGLDLEISYFKAVRLQLIGFFFNTAMPGAVGGDIVKAVYVIREQKALRKTPALLTVLLDRVIGLVGLFVVAGIAVMFNWRFVSHDSALMSLSLLAGGAFAAILVGFAVCFYPFPAGRDPINNLLSAKLPGFAVLKSIYEAFRSYRTKPLLLVSVVLLSVTVHAASIAYAFYMTTIIAGFTPDVATFGTIYPLGLMTTALPLAPGGLGVGHLAFDRLFTLVGWTGGANVFNVLILGQLALNMLGVIPYLLHRVEMPDMEELQEELAS